METIPTLLRSAVNLINSQRSSEALTILQSILILDPNNENALCLSGNCLANLKRYPEAIDSYNRALKINQNNSSTWNYGGVALFELGRYSEAFEAFNRALVISPNDTTIKNNRDLASKSLNEQNIKQSNESLALEWNKKGLDHFNQKNYAEATKSFNQAFRLNPNNTVFKSNRDLSQKELEKSKSKPSQFSPFIALFMVIVIGAFIFGIANHPAGQSLPSTPAISASLASIVPDSSADQKISLASGSISLGPDHETAISTSKAIDYSNPVVKNFANSHVTNANSGSYREFGVNQISDIWDAIRPPHWTYVGDAHDFNYFTSASDTITNGLSGNCEDFAVLNAALVESIGGSSRVITACPPNGGECHAYAEAFISDNYSDLQSTTDYLRNRYGERIRYYHKYTDSLGNTGYWLNLDWQANYPGGPFFQDDGTYKIFYPNGAYDVITNSGSTVVISQASTRSLSRLQMGL